MGKKKKFIDKKSAVTFRLLHRSQKDPLVTDENAPQHVLHQLEDKHDKKSELLKYGIYFDDGYDYMQHLRATSGQGELVIVEPAPTVKSKAEKGINLPSSVFPSNVEEKVGVLNRAPPQSGLNLDLDPDIVAAMDSDFDFSDSENELEDDFIQIANGPASGEEENGNEFSGESCENYSDEERDELMSLEREETKSRFTEYSMTSSVIRRNEQLTLLDDRFEEMFADYDDNEIGALDTEEIEGYADDKILEKLIKDEDVINNIEFSTDRTINYVETDSSSDEENFEYMEIKPKEKWDCESILSTNSTLYNHPKLIEAPPGKIKLNSLGIPITKNKLTASALGKHDSQLNKNTGPGSIASAISLLSIRSKDETAVEKRNRKKAFRDFKRERRVERKLNTAAFKEEKRKMEKMMANNKSRFQVAL